MDSLQNLERAINSLQAQTYNPNEIVIGLDPGQDLPDHVKRLSCNSMPIKAAMYPTYLGAGLRKQSNQACQAAALNCAIGQAGCELILILEDDDTLASDYLETAVELIREGWEFISCSSLQVWGETDQTSILHFPTPSGWVFSRIRYYNIKGFDPSYRMHLDNDLLGQISKAGWRRLHLVPDAPKPPMNQQDLKTIMHYSWVAPVKGWANPPVIRHRHAQANLVKAEGDPALLSKSDDEYQRLLGTYGSIPW